MKTEANTPDEYIAQLPEDRKNAMLKLRTILLKNLPKGFKEEISYGMPGYVVPLDIYPKGYHCNPELPLPFINLASQKNYIALYHNGIYANKNLLTWFQTEYTRQCKTKLDMGKSCIRFKRTENIPYQLITELVKKITVEEFIQLYETSLKKK